jgi:CubicO group peptidase (beta-lactamase class C family)
MRRTRAAKTMDQPLTNSLGQLVRSAVASYVEGTPYSGLAVGVIRGGKGHIECFGSLEKGREGTVDAHTLFEIGSITKLMTANLLAQFVNEGRVGLDDPVSTLLPDGVSVPEFRGQKITLRHLATHTSSLPRLPGNLNETVKDEANPYAHYTVSHLYLSLSTTRLRQPVGRRCEYSNLGMGLLGHALARAGGCSYEELLRSRLLVPLEMNETAITLSPEQQARFATGHTDSGKPTAHWDLPTLEGAGAVRSTVEDMLKYVAASLDPAPASIAASLELCQTVQNRIPRSPPAPRSVLTGALLAAVGQALQYWVPVAPSCFTFLLTLFLPFITSIIGWGFWGGLACGVVTYAGTIALWGNQFGWIWALPWFIVPLLLGWWRAGPSEQRLGWHELALPDGSEVLWHNGGTGGFASFLGIMRSQQLGVVLLSNSTSSTDETALALLKSLSSNSVSESPDVPPA